MSEAKPRKPVINPLFSARPSAKRATLPNRFDEDFMRCTLEFYQVNIQFNADPKARAITLVFPLGDCKPVEYWGEDGKRRHKDEVELYPHQTQYAEGILRNLRSAVDGGPLTRLMIGKNKMVDFDEPVLDRARGTLTQRIRINPQKPYRFGAICEEILGLLENHRDCSDVVPRTVTEAEIMREKMDLAAGEIEALKRPDERLKEWRERVHRLKEAHTQTNDAGNDSHRLLSRYLRIGYGQNRDDRDDSTRDRM